jgi:hypothetical protein
VNWIEGDVQQEAEQNGGLALAVRIVALRSGEERYWSGETVSIPSQYVARIEERQLSRWRTVAASSGLLAVVVGLFVGVSEITTGDDRGGVGPPGQQ